MVDLPHPSLDPEGYCRALVDDVEAAMSQWGFEGNAEPLAGSKPFVSIEEGWAMDSVFAWTFTGIHNGGNERRGSLFGRLAWTGVDVLVTGTTIVVQGDEGPMFQRYLDWPCLLGQIGITVTSRPAVAPPVG